MVALSIVFNTSRNLVRRKQLPREKSFKQENKKEGEKVERPSTYTHIYICMYVYEEP